ncbi:MAG: RagB/SusD family nutrient uptake outer membrane protein [Saprospiraceae bacterium]
MKKFIVFNLIIAIATLTSCFKDLDTVPLDPNLITSGTVFNDPNSYKQFLAKLYAGLAVSGQEGPAGQPDISGIDEGFGQYLRGLYYHQELPTDEALIGWNDQTIWDFHDIDWTPSDGFTFAFYSRIFYQIPLANEFLRETTSDKLDSRGVSADLRREIDDYRAEARFLRALSYWHALDIFRNVPFVTEDDKVGSFFPRQIKGAELFAYIESELLAIESSIKAPRTNEYGRADRAAVWMLLAKLYLNAEVYTGQKKYTECLATCQKILSAGYTLEPNYSHLFLADNHRSNEIIFPIAFDGINTRTYGGMTFIIFAGIGGAINPINSGVSGGWGGTRTTRQLVEKFPSNLTGSVVDFNYSRNLKAIYIPSTLNGFNGTDDKNKLASLNNSNVYEGYRYFPEENAEFVVLRFPSSTLANKLGDNDGDGKLETNGANIKVPGKGLYYIKVDLTSGVNTYTLERRDFELNGSAVPGGVKDFSWDAGENKLRVKLDLEEGNISFREKSGKVIYGDDQLDGILESTGSIAIQKSGGYDILIDLTRPDYTYAVKLTSFDKRGIFGAQGQNLDIPTYADIGIFTNGYAVLKFKNVTSDGKTGSNVNFPDTDFPMFRLADAYLMAAEAILRGATGGSSAQALEYFNEVRTRAYTGTSGNVTSSDLNLDLILDERARELYWECQRRTDLVRFNKFTTADYLWAWKGGVKEGRAVHSKYNIFPIPSADMGANPNLVQNPDY